MKKFFVLMMVVILILTGLQLALAQNPKNKGGKPDLQRLLKLKELSGLRTEKSRTFLEKDGRKTVYLSAQPLNYQESDGKYYPIDTSLVSDNVAKAKINDKHARFRHKSLKNVLRTRFADNSDEGLILEHGKNSIQFIIKHQNRRKAVVKNNKIRYNKVFDNCDLEYTVLPGALKDELIFSKVPTTPVISYQVNFNGLRHKKGKNGVIELMDAAGKTVFNLMPSVMFEQGNPKAFKMIETRFHWEKGQMFCDLVLDMKWLKDKKRKYPIVVDPTLSIDSNGSDWEKFLLHCPEGGVPIDTTMNGTAPEWKGYWFVYDKLKCYVRDLQDKFDYFWHEDFWGFGRKEISFLSKAGHDYEVVVHGGHSFFQFLFWREEHDGYADATITYGDLFATYKSSAAGTYKDFDCVPLDNDVVLKKVEVAYPQTIRFNYVEGLSIKEANGGNLTIHNGALNLRENTTYEIRLAPRRNGSNVTHYTVSIDFPYLTKAYESRITLGTYPGYIDSTIKVPQSSNLLLGYEALKNGLVSGRGLPEIKVLDLAGAEQYKKPLDLINYDKIYGGDSVYLEREQLYHLIVSRGKNGVTGWGSIDLNPLIIQNKMENLETPEVANLTMVNQSQEPASGWARSDYRLRFDYEDPESNTLKEYTLVVQKSGSEPVPITFKNLNLGNGKINISRTIGNLGFKTGDIINCKITDAWDGFNKFSSLAGGINFTIDDQAPTIDELNGSLTENNTLSINCLAQDTGSGLKDKILTWRVDGGEENIVSLDSSMNSYSISNLPANNRIHVILSATDNLGNTATKTKTYYTYPSKANLIAPVAIYGTNANKYQATLKIENPQNPAPFYRIVRYRESVSPQAADYDTGYLDVNTFNAMKAGPPVVSITEPYRDSAFTRPANITIAASAFDVDGTIAKVEFYSGSALIGTAVGQPYTITWNNVPLGNYSVTAKAYDNDGLTSTSNPVNFTVVNIPPSVSIDTVTINGNNVTVNATAVDPDGSIARVDFYIGDTLLGSDSTYPFSYSFDWDYAADTDYILTAKTIDNDGGIALSNSKKIGYKIVDWQTQYVEENWRWESRDYGQVMPQPSDNIRNCHFELDPILWFVVFSIVCDTWVCDIIPIQVPVRDFIIEDGENPATTPTPTPVPGPQPTPSGNEQDCYWIPDQPAQRHQKYIYRIYTKNGDRELYADSAPIPVVNNVPEFLSVQPAPGAVTDSGGIVTLVSQARDLDADELWYTYTITGQPSSGETKNREWTFGSVNAPLQNGEYTWTITVRDNYGGTVQTSGTLSVNKDAACASFTINNGALYTNNYTGAVNLTIANMNDVADQIRIANSASGPWTTYDRNQQSQIAINDWNVGTADGTKTVYLQSHSRNTGLWGPVVQRQIILDHTGPSIEGVSIVKRGKDQAVYFSWSGGTDAASGLSGKVNIQRQINGLWTNYQSNFEEGSIEIPANPGTGIAIRVQLQDNAGNVSEWSGPVTAYPLAAKVPAGMITAAGGYEAGLGHYVTAKFAPVQGAVQYKAECVQNPGGGYNGAVTPGSDGLITLANTGLIPHETYKYRILTYNEDNEVTTGEEFAVTLANNFIDTPAGAGPSGYIRQTETGFSFTADIANTDPDGDALTIDYYVSSDGNNYTKLETSYITGLTSGATYSWYAVISDGHGGTCRTDPVSFTPDVTEPVITVDNTSVEYALEHRVRIQASDTGTGLASLQYRINNSQLRDVTGDILINNQGANYLYVVATDQAGNTSIFSHVYSIDHTPPTSQGIQFLLPQIDGRFLAADDAVPVQWTAADPESGIAQFKYLWSTFSGGCDTAAMTPLVLAGQMGTYQTLLPGDFADGATYYLYIQAQNFLGIPGPVIVSPPLSFDRTAPIVTINSLSGGTAFSGQYYLPALAGLGAAVAAADPDTGISKVEYAVTGEPSGEAANWYESLTDLTANAVTVHGNVYYLAVRATNGSNLTATAYSEPIFIESTGPQLTVETDALQPETGLYKARIRTNDPETMVVTLQYCIGSAPGGADFSTGMPGTQNGWFTLNYPAEMTEIRQTAAIPVGTTYYLTVKATNIAGLTTTQSSGGTRVTGPSSTAPEVGDDGIYTSERTTLHFTWNFAASAREINGYEYQIRSLQGIIKNWTVYDPGDIRVAAATPISLLVTGLSLENNRQYFCDVRAKYDDGTYSDTGSSDGIRSDWSAPVIANFKAPDFGSAAGIICSWEASDPESGVQCYLGLGTAPGEIDVTNGWINAGNLRRYQLSADSTGSPIPFENGRRYYITLMVENGSGLAVQQVSPAVVMDLSIPPTPVVMDDGSYTNRNDRLRANWKWTPPDPESGTREYLYTVTAKRALSGGEYWVNAGTETEFELTGLNLTQGKTYYIAVKAVNNAGAESSPGFSNGILVDTTAPDPPLAVDYGDYSLSSSSLRVQLLASDVESGIGEYKLSLGTLDDPDAIFGNRAILTDSGLENLNLESLALQEGQVYFFTVSAVNHANLTSVETTSDGIMVDSKAPVVAAVNVQGRYLSDSGRLVFDWKAGTTPSGIVAAQYAISSNPNGAGLAWRDLNLSGSKVVTGLELNDNETYYVYIRVQNRAQYEEAPDTWSVPARSHPVTIDRTPPEIIKINAPQFTSEHFLLQWEAKDEISGIVEYRYAVGSHRGAADITGGWVTLLTNETAVSFYRDDLPIGDKYSCYISVKAKNGAGLWSEIHKSDAIVTDLTPPVVIKLDYASPYVKTKDSIQGIIWEASDPDTGISAYRITATRVKDNSPLAGAARIPVGETGGILDLSGLSLEEGQAYYLAMQVQNGVGNWSNVKYSNGFVVDTIPPELQVIGAAPELVTNSGKLTVILQSTEPGVVNVQLEKPGGETVPQPGAEPYTIAIVNQAGYEFDESLEGTYILTLTPVDVAGNPGRIIIQNIRLNAKPVANIGPDQTVTKGTTISFDPEISDSDGTVNEYLWSFGDGGTSADPKPAHTYSVLGTYKVTLKVKDNDAKWSEEAVSFVTVTNTAAGTLQLDEEWESTEPIMITGDITVPQGKVLTIKAGTRIDFSGNYQILVNGKVIINGSEGAPVFIGGDTYWNGIRIENADPGSVISHAVIQRASAGLVIYNSAARITDSIFKNNEIGLHIVHCNPVVQNCGFQNNSVYGIKEDDGAEPEISGCSFANNGAADYYEDEQGIIAPGSLDQ